MEMGLVMTFKAHRKLANRLMSAYRSKPPPGYSPVSLTQIRNADLKFWELAGQFTRRGIKTPSITPVLDGLVDQLLTDQRFQILLNPLPGAKSRQRSRSRSVKRKTKNEGKGGRGNKGGKAKGSGKGGGRGGEYRPVVPREMLPDGVAYNDEDEPICFGFNCRRGCDLVKDGEKCKWGWHICAVKGCFDMHSLQDHGKKRGEKKGITYEK